jgi:tRNA(Ile)-lysidine synthase
MDYNPQVREALLRLAEQARWVEQYIRETVEKTFRSLIISRTDQELVLNAAALARKGRIVQAELVRHAISRFDLGEQDLTFGHMKSVTDLVAEQVSGKQVTLPGGMTAQLVYNRLVFSMPTAEPREAIAEQVAIHLPGRTVLPLRRIEIDCAVQRVGPSEMGAHLHNRDRFEEWLDLDNIRPPLVVRSRQPGDRFWPLGAPGSKKVADFLSDEKIDPGARDRVAVLCDQLGPIWIIGYRIDERAKLSRTTREALCVRARYLDE